LKGKEHATLSCPWRHFLAATFSILPAARAEDILTAYASMNTALLRFCRIPDDSIQFSRGSLFFARVEHRLTRSRTPQTNGMERFNGRIRIVRDATGIWARMFPTAPCHAPGVT
jgi:hypothetical protein